MGRSSSRPQRSQAGTSPRRPVFGLPGLSRIRTGPFRPARQPEGKYRRIAAQAGGSRSGRFGQGLWLDRLRSRIGSAGAEPLGSRRFEFGLSGSLRISCPKPFPAFGKARRGRHDGDFSPWGARHSTACPRSSSSRRDGTLNAAPAAGCADARVRCIWARLLGRFSSKAWGVASPRSGRSAGGRRNRATGFGGVA